MKKTWVTVLVALMLLGMLGSVASANGDINVGDLIRDQGGWTNIENGTFEGDKLTLQPQGSPLAYTARTFTDETFHVRATFDTTPNAWPGFMLRGSSATTNVWDGESGYLIVFKEEIMELQRWRNGTQKWILQDAPHNGAIRNGGTHDIVLSAKNEEGGVRIVVTVDGTELMNELDENSPVSEGYFGFYNFDTVTVLQGLTAGAAAGGAGGEVSGDTGAASGDAAAGGAAGEGEGTTTLPKTGSTVATSYLYLLAALLVGGAVLLQVRKNRAGAGG